MKTARMRLLTTIMLVATYYSQAYSQMQPVKNDSVLNAIVKVNSDNKTIQVDKLNLPASTPIKDVLVYLPELVNRKNEYIAANYDIQIEGISVGDARDAALSQLHIADVKVIKVNENSLNSITSFGQGGSINIILKESDKKLSGSVTLDAAYVPDYVGGILLNHKTKKWSVKAFGNVEYYKPEKFKEHSDYFGYNEEFTESGQRFFSENTQVSAKYQPTESDEFKFHFSNVILDQKKNTSYLDNNDLRYKEDITINTCNINMMAEYSRQFTNKSNISAFLRYSYVPETVMNNIHIPEGSDMDYFITDYNVKAHNLQFKCDYSLPLVTISEVKSLKLNTGIQTSVRNSDNDALRVAENYGSAKLSNEKNYFLRPYVVLTGRLKSFSFTGTADFQHYRYKIGMNDKTDFNTVENNVTGMANAMWAINNRNGLRLSYNHSISRPTGPQLFPYMINDPLDAAIIQGNPNLRPYKIDNIDLDYILNLSNSDHTLTFNIGVDYSYAHDLIKSYSAHVPETGETATYYDNYGNFNIHRADLMAYFSKGIFSVSLTTNFYLGHDAEGDGQNDFTHFNISLTPSLNFKSGWNGSASVYYNSKVENLYYVEGALCYANFRLGKTWKRWNIHFFSLVNLNDRAIDKYYDSNGKIYAQKNYDYMKYEVGVGTRYSF